MNLQAKLKGEQAIARAVLRVLPLIDKYFKPFDGKRAHIQTGRSAAFQKVVTAFRNEAEAQTGAQIFIHDQYQAVSVHVKLRHPDPDNRNGGCIYYSSDVYFGEVDTSRSPIGNYKHTLTAEHEVGKATQCQQVLSTTVGALETAIKNYEYFKAQLAHTKGTLAPCFRAIFTD